MLEHGLLATLVAVAGATALEFFGISVTSLFSDGAAVFP